MFFFFNQIVHYGMNERIGNRVYITPEDDDFATEKPYSEATAQIIDEEVKLLIDSAYESTIKLVREKKDLIEKVRPTTK